MTALLKGSYPMLEVKNIGKIYINEKSEDISALSDVSFSFPETGLFFITGKSGSGKTTLIDIIGGLDVASSGAVFYKGTDMKDFSTEEWERIRQNDFGYIFQENNLFENMEIIENIFLLKEQSGGEDLSKLQSLMNGLGLHDIDLHRRANELSAGQKQRISILRALTHSSQVILADELTENLDMATSRDIMNILFEISKSKLVIVVTHDIVLAREFPSTLITLESGKLVSVEKANGVIKSITELIITKSNLDNPIDLTREIRANQIYNFLQENTNSQDDQFIVRIQKKDEPPAENKPAIPNFEMDKKNHQVSFKSIYRFSLKFINILNIRLIISAFLVLISLLFSLFIGIVMLYDEKESITDYMIDYQVTELRLSNYIQFLNLFNEEDTVRVDTGQNLYSEIRSFCDQVYKVKDHVGISLEPLDHLGPMKYVKYAIYDTMLLPVIGNYPQTDNEVLISDYLYQKLFGDSQYETPKTIYDSNGEITIVGIVQSGYEKADQYNEDLKEYILDDLYSFVYSKSIPHLNPYIFTRDENMRRELFLENGTDSVSQGDFPDSTNEVVISSGIAETYSLEIGDIFHFPNIYDSSFSGRYDSEINIYDLFPQGLVIVGIVDSTENDLYLNSADYARFYDLYFEYFYYDYFVAEIQNSAEMSSIISSGLYINDPIVEMISEITREIDFIKTIIVPMLFLAALLLFLSCYNAVSSVLHKMDKKIGVLRTQGISQKNIRQVFLIQIFYLFVFCFALALFGYLFSIGYLNGLFTRNLHYDLVIFSAKVWFVVLVSIITFGLLIGLLHLSTKKTLSKTIFSNLYK